MDNEREHKEEKFLTSILAKKAIIFVVVGIIARVFMLFFYYYTHIIDSQRSWGDLGEYFNKNLTSPPLTVAFLILFRLLSFGSIQIFAFWGFFMDLLTCVLFYLVLKSFNIKNKNYAFGLFLINPFFFISNSFSIENCGYHITDALFLSLLLTAFIFYPKEESYARYLFYIFLGLSMCSKYYTLPAIGFFFIKYIFEKNWKELRICLLCQIPMIIIFLILPFFFFDWFSAALLSWSRKGSALPLYIRLIPFIIISLLFILFRLRNSDGIEISIIAIIAVGSFMIFSYPYLRWFQTLIFIGILKEKEFFKLRLNLKIIKKEIIVNNHLITFYLSIVASFLAIIFILYVH